MWGPGLPAEGVPERGYTVNGDDHDRIETLEKALNDPKDGIIAQLAEIRGRVMTWAIIIGMVVSVAGTVLTNALVRPHESAAAEESRKTTEAVERLLRRLDREDQPTPKETRK